MSAFSEGAVVGAKYWSIISGTVGAIAGLVVGGPAMMIAHGIGAAVGGAITGALVGGLVNKNIQEKRESEQATKAGAMGPAMGGPAREQTITPEEMAAMQARMQQAKNFGDRREEQQMAGAQGRQ